MLVGDGRGGCRQRLVKKRFEQAAAFGLGRLDLRLEPIAQRHQFVKLGDDTLLLGEGRSLDKEPGIVSSLDIIPRTTNSRLPAGIMVIALLATVVAEIDICAESI